MRIATWNVNSLRSRIDRVEALLERHDIDVLALQETKAREDQLPLMGLQSLGYDVAAAGHNQWNGVAIISRVGIEDVTVGFAGHAGLGRARRRRRGAGDRGDAAAACGSGRSTSPTAARSTTRTTSTSSTGWPGCARRRRDWLARTPVALVGDWNIAPQDEDVFDMAAFAKDTHVTPPERAAFQAFLDDGWTSTSCARTRRARTSSPTGTTTGSASSGTAACASTSSSARRRSPQRVTGAFIDRDERAGTGASDHAPVIVDLD